MRTKQEIQDAINAILGLIVNGKTEANGLDATQKAELAKLRAELTALDNAAKPKDAKQTKGLSNQAQNATVKKAQQDYRANFEANGVSGNGLIVEIGQATIITRTYGAKSFDIPTLYILVKGIIKTPSWNGTRDNAGKKIYDFSTSESQDVTQSGLWIATSGELMDKLMAIQALAESNLPAGFDAVNGVITYTLNFDSVKGLPKQTALPTYA